MAGILGQRYAPEQPSSGGPGREVVAAVRRARQEAMGT